MRESDHRESKLSDSAAEPPTHFRFVVLVLVALASTSAYLTRYCISAANTVIQADFGINDKQMGWLMSAFALGYFICQVPSGWLGNRYGTRAAFSVSSVVWSLYSVGSACTFSLLPMALSRMGLGLAQAGLTPLSAQIIKDWIPPSSRGMSSALIGAAMSVGGALTMWLTGLLLDTYGYSWRAIFRAYSLVGVVWAILFYVVFRNQPRQHSWVNRAECDLIRELPDVTASAESSAGESPNKAGVFEAEPAVGGRDLAMNMYRSRSLWALCVQSFFRAAGYLFFAQWFFAFLEYAYGISKLEAGMLTSLPMLAVVAGSMCGGYVVDFLWSRTKSKWISRSGTAVVSLGLCAVLTLFSAWTSTATELAVVIAIGAFFSGIGSPAAWAATIDVGDRRTAVTVGVMNMAGCVAGIVMPIVVGFLIDQIKETKGEWNQVIYLHAAIYLAAAVSWLFVNPNESVTKPRPESSD